MIAKRLDEKGYSVFAGCLLPEEEGARNLRDACSEKLRVVPLDVTSDESVKSAGRIVRQNLGSSSAYTIVHLSSLVLSSKDNLPSRHVFYSLVNIEFSFAHSVYH